MIGDAATDIAAGRAAGCRTALVEHPRSAHRRSGDDVAADLRAPDLAAGRLCDPADGRVASRGMLDRLETRIFADGADLDAILALHADPLIKGFTTNPTLMWKAGLTDYEEFAHRLLEQIREKPISFEVFADDEDEIRRQAKKLATWGPNVYVKIPVTTTTGVSMAPLVRELSEDGVQVNVTALFTTAQVELITAAVKDGAPSCVSVFAGRIADAGVDPVPIMRNAVSVLSQAPRAELIWASPREVLNLVQADDVGCHIITMTHDLIAKVKNLGKDLDQFSLETVQMFHRDAAAAGLHALDAARADHGRRRVHRQHARRSPGGRRSRGADPRRLPHRAARLRGGGAGAGGGALRGRRPRR